MPAAGPDLIIDYIDELARGRSRLSSVMADVHGDAARELKGLAGTILSAVVRAQVPPTVPQIGRSLGYPRQTVQRHVDDLTRQGLVATLDNPDHKTAKRLVPTDAGRARYDASNRASLAWAETFAASFERADLETMVRTMRAIRHELERITRDGGRPAQGNTAG